MALQDQLEQLRNVNLSDLDVNTIGSWPPALKFIVLVLAFVLALAGGYFGYLAGKLEDLERLAKREESLKRTYEEKAGDAANLEQLRRQKQQMEETFGALLRQLPSDTEVPGLLEDITMTGINNGLRFEAIDLEAEREQEFYVELPIAITVQGSYHDLGAFVSSVSNLSRIVTLHDFSIAPEQNALRMEIEARTYRYLPPDGGS